jgi:hypothetical protein
MSGLSDWPRRAAPAQGALADFGGAQQALQGGLISLPREMGDDAPEREFKVQLAQTQAQHRAAEMLMQRMYAWRGYQGAEKGHDRLLALPTLVILERGTVVGTLSVGADGHGHRLSVEQSFPGEVNALRRSQRRLCEFTRLAMDGRIKSKALLGALFHAACVYAHNGLGAEFALIEVNPRHLRFYVALLGFEILSGERLNTRVHAPGMLLSLDLTWALKEIGRLGGKPHLAAVEKSFYPYFLGPDEEDKVLAAPWTRVHGG